MIARSAESAAEDAVASEPEAAASSSIATESDQGGANSSIVTESVAQRLVVGAAVVAAATAPSPATTDVANESDLWPPDQDQDQSSSHKPGRCAAVLQEQWAPELPPGWESVPLVAAAPPGAAQVRGRESPREPDLDLEHDSVGTSGRDALRISPATQDEEASAPPPVIAVLPPLEGSSAFEGPGSARLGSPSKQGARGSSTKPQPKRKSLDRRTSSRGRGGAGRADEGPWPLMEYFGKGPLQLEPGVAMSCDARITLNGGPFTGAGRFAVRPELPPGFSLDATTGRVSGRLREAAAGSWSSRHEVTALVDVPGQSQCELRAKLVFMARPKAPSAAAPPAPPEASEPQLALALAEPELQPWQLSELWTAIASGDLDTLRVLVDSGTLRSDNVDSPKYVDEAGRTLLELARKAGDRMVLSFLYSLMRIGTSRSAALADCPPDGGLAARGPGVEIDYPTLPHELMLGRSCRHSVVVLDGVGTPRSPSESSGPRGPLFSVSPPLPEGLVFEARTGTIRGTPEVETWERIHVVSFSTVDSPHASEKTDPVLEASCHIRIMVVAALQGLSYPRHECIVDPEGTSDADGQGDPDRAATVLPPLAGRADAGRPVSRGRQFGRQLSPASEKAQSNPFGRQFSPFGRQFSPVSGEQTKTTEFGRERTTKHFCLLPTLEQGSADAFHAEPPLPAGMAIDRLTGEIRGVPSSKATPAQKRATSEHTVVAQNTVGISSCRIRIEAHIGSWGMVLMKVGMLHCARRECSSPNATQRVQFATQATPEGDAGRPFTAGNLLQVNWTQACEMGRAVVDRSGTPVTIRSPLGAAHQTVKGMPASALVDCLGLQREPNSTSLLLQAILCCESVAERRASPRLGASAPAGSCVPSLAAAEDLDGRPVVYVPEPGDIFSRSAPGALQLRAGSVAAASPGASAAVPFDTAFLPLSPSPRGPPPAAASLPSGAGGLRPQAREDTEGIRRQFDSLLPLWREKLRESGDRYGGARRRRLENWVID